jgi:hypothetical protein
LTTRTPVTRSATRSRTRLSISSDRGREPGGGCSRSRRCVAADPVVAGCDQRMSRDRRRSASTFPTGLDRW